MRRWNHPGRKAIVKFVNLFLRLKRDLQTQKRKSVQVLLLTVASVFSFFLCLFCSFSFLAPCILELFVGSASLCLSSLIHWLGRA